MRLKSNIVAIFAVCAFLCGYLSAAEPTEQELVIFTAQKYKADYKTQDEKTKTEIINDYKRTMKISDEALSNPGVLNDPEFKIISSILSTEVWAKKFTESIQITDQEIKDLFDKAPPKKLATYKLRNILVGDDEKQADAFIKTIDGSKTNAAKLAKFKEIAKKQSKDAMTASKEGDIGWVDVNRLDPTVQKTLATKKANDVIKIKIPKVGWQILMIEDATAERTATFEESKPVIVNFIKQQRLKDRVEQILGVTAPAAPQQPAAEIKK